MPKVFTSKTQKIGELGEKIAEKFLKNKGFKIVDRNYTRKWGEIDIITKKGTKLHFIEVKTVSRITPNTTNSSNPGVEPPDSNINPAHTKTLTDRYGTESDKKTDIDNVIRETKNNDIYRAEDNMHPWKLKRMSRAIQTYLMSNNALEDIDWQVDLYVVKLDIINKKAVIEVVKDIVL